MKFKFGRGTVEYPFPVTGSIKTITSTWQQPLSSPDQLIRQALKAPVGTAPLPELAMNRSTAAILISGKDRITGSELFIPHLLAELETAGLAAENVTIVFATGTHEKISPDDKLRLLGEEAAARVKIVIHDCHDAQGLKLAGRTTRGNNIYVNKTVLAADLKILTGRINYHYFAGFSGGAKAILPGASGFDTILFNHRLVLSEEDGVNPQIGHGRLEDNPVRIDMEEAAGLVKPDFIFNTILDAQHRLLYCVAGDMYQAHRAGCGVAAAYHRIRQLAPADLIVASCGGYPYDINFMQAIKAIFNCEPVLKPGGTLIVLAECERGINPGFLKWLAYADVKNLHRSILADYDLTGHNSYMLKLILREKRIILVSALAEQDIRQAGFIPARSLADAMAAVQPLTDKLVYLVPDANITYLEKYI